MKCIISSILPLVPSNKVQLKDLSGKNIILIGHHFDNDIVTALISKLSLELDFNKAEYSSIVSQSVHIHPNNSKKRIMVYTAIPSILSPILYIIHG